MVEPRQIAQRSGPHPFVTVHERTPHQTVAARLSPPQSPPFHRNNIQWQPAPLLHPRSHRLSQVQSNGPSGLENVRGRDQGQPSRQNSTSERPQSRKGPSGTHADPREHDHHTYQRPCRRSPVGPCIRPRPCQSLLGLDNCVSRAPRVSALVLPRVQRYSSCN